MVKQSIYRISTTMADNGHGMRQIMKSPTHITTSFSWICLDLGWKKEIDLADLLVRRNFIHIWFYTCDPLSHSGCPRISHASFHILQAVDCHPLTSELFAAAMAKNVHPGGVNPCLLNLGSSESDKLIHTGIPQWNRIGVYLFLSKHYKNIAISSNSTQPLLAWIIWAMLKHSTWVIAVGRVSLKKVADVQQNSMQIGELLCRELAQIHHVLAKMASSQQQNGIEWPGFFDLHTCQESVPFKNSFSTVLDRGLVWPSQCHHSFHEFGKGERLPIFEEQMPIILTGNDPNITLMPPSQYLESLPTMRKKEAGLHWYCTFQFREQHSKSLNIHGNLLEMI